MTLAPKSYPRAVSEPTAPPAPTKSRTFCEIPDTQTLPATSPVHEYEALPSNAGELPPRLRLTALLNVPNGFAAPTKAPVESTAFSLKPFAACVFHACVTPAVAWKPLKLGVV